jgi:hypothetical protein
MGSSSFDGLGSPPPAEDVVVQIQIPLSPRAEVSDLQEMLAQAAQLGGLRRFELKYMRPYAVVERLVTRTEAEENDWPILAESDDDYSDIQVGDDAVARTTLFTLYEMARAGDVALKDLDSHEANIRILVDEARTYLLKSRLHPVFLLIGDGDAFNAAYSKWGGADPLQGLVIEHDANIPEDSFILFGGPSKDCDKSQLRLAVRVSFPLPEEIRDELETDASDGGAGTGTVPSRPRVAEEGSDSKGDGPPPFFGAPTE